ncbi:MAG: hypothetical protein Q8N18_18690 [Opitutaceae bacterium]|nr:hypothetical protein [Opitutaceae bacterium]
MSLPPEHEKEFAQFPAVLRELVMAELAAGNTISAFSHGFPAAPCGAYLKLARPVSSRPRQKTPDLDFYDRNTSNYSGEFTDAKRHFFVLEPPHPPKPPPDLAAIRAKQEASYAAANAAPNEPAAGTPSSAQSTPGNAAAAERTNQKHLGSDPKSVLARFKASMTIDYDKWHDGIGYEVDLIKQANPAELQAIEDLLIKQRNGDWRDVAALAALDSPRAKAALKAAFRSGDTQVRMAVHSHAPELMTKTQRIASLVQALEQGDNYSGLTEALLEVETFHPPEIMTALLRGLMDRDGGTACHFAAMLYFLHGKSASAFDWNHRPFFLRFNTTDLVEREKAIRELCETIGADPGRCIKPKPAKRSLTTKKAKTVRRAKP